MSKNKPLVSFCIITYNQEVFIKDAVLSALNQDYEPMEIIISDDGSRDDTVKIINEIVSNYNGSKEIIVNVNNPNLGIREHVNKVIYDIAKGDYILLAAGDDVSHKDRTKTYVEYFNKFPELMSISCKSKEVDVNLTPINTNEYWDNSYTIFNMNDYIEHKDFFIYSGDSRGLRRAVIDKFPKLKYSYSEDIFLFFRSLLLGSACYIRQPLVYRRHHGNNVSEQGYSNIGLASSNKQLQTDLQYAIEKQYIDIHLGDSITKKLEYMDYYRKLYWTSPYTSFRTFFYRILRKLFKVSK